MYVFDTVFAAIRGIWIKAKYGTVEQRFRQLAVKKGSRVKLKEQGYVYRLKKADAVFYLPLYETDLIQQNILLSDRFYESRQLHAVMRFGKGILNDISSGSMIDAGANIGNHSIYFAKVCHARKVYSFEPVKSTYEILEKNVALNHLQNQIHRYNVGLGEAEGKARIGAYDAANIGGTSLLLDDAGEIPVIVLDSIRYENKVTFIKIDTEGFELQVLRGAKDIIERDHPYIWAEVGGNKEAFALRYFSHHGMINVCHKRA